MSTARHHAEWLSLVEASGPFLSMEVLLGAFPQGLDAHESDHFRLLKQAYEEWLENSQESGIHRAWIHWVLRETLEFPDEVLLTGQAIPQGLQVTVAEHQETLHPDWIVANPPQSPLDKANPPQSPLDKANPPQSPLDKGGQRGVKPRLLVQVYSPEQGLEKPFKSGRWKASPATRMMELLHGTQVRLGLVTNGEHWMLVRAPRGETTSYISWYGNLWVEEKITLRAFRCLLGVRRFFGVTDEETIEALFEKSKNAQHEVTDQLGYQVRKAVEVLVQKLDRIDQDRNRTLLQNISDRELYEAALFVMMRLVFLFSAEEKGLIPHPESQLYENYYAVSTLREKLREEADKYGEEILERRHDAWCRLLATFRAVYGGVACDLLAIPAYGGDLFNPNKFAFLEGREEDSHQNLERKPISVDNRTVLHLLEALQILQVKVPGGGSEPRRLSFRALDVEQIGHVYEGLLDHTAVRASTPVLGLIGTKDKEPEVSLDALEMQLAKGEDALVKYLKEATGRSEAALRKIITPPNLPFLRGGTTSNSPRVKEGLRGVNLEPHEEGRFLVACHNDSQLWERIKHFAQLIRRDTFDYPLIIPQGSIYVTQGSDRRETGTHYTPKSLTEEIVRYTLEPLVYEGVAQGKPKEEWQLKSATELLNLEICDMAMGSGAFLVQVCRYLGERLVEAWERAENPPMSPLAKGGFRGVNRDNKKWIVVTPEGKLSQSRPEECLIPEDATERLIVAKRIVAERCIYGVDKNPLAVEMAKLSLWLETMQRDKPFTFLDHALKCGDSLVGVSLKQLHCWDLDTSLGVRQLGIGIDLMQREVDEAIAYRLQIEAKPVITQQDQKEKANLLKLANSRINDLRTRCDLLIQSYLVEGSKANKEALRESLLLAAQGKKDVTETEKVILPDLEKLRPFHWELEFPEVFLTPLNPPLPRGESSSNVPLLGKEGLGEVKGFDALVGNPPFMGGKKITGALGNPYRDYLVEWLANNQKGNADLCAYFFLRGQQLINSKGGFGLVATNTIAQGDTREVGLDQLVAKGSVLPRAVSSRKWEGTASLEVAYVWLRQGEWKGDFVLDEKPVSGITPYLTEPGQSVGNPYRLIANQNKSFQGSIVLGMGFVLTPEEAQALIDKNPHNKDVLFPYLNGEDLNSRPDQSPSRWIINFFDWALDAEHDDPKKPKGSPYAADYPDCLKILEEKVKPERTKRKANGEFVQRKPLPQLWWIYAEKRPGLYKAIAGRDRILVRARIANMHSMVYVLPNRVYNEKVVVFVECSFAILQSNIHETWAREYSSTLKKDMQYTPSDCFETFPFPDIENKAEIKKKLEQIGEKYYSDRQNIMQTRQEGLTKTYNRFHNPNENSEDIQILRQLHVEMDCIVADAYGWNNPPESPLGKGGHRAESPLDKGGHRGVNLDHNFHQTKQGIRYTISEEARREILDRLLQLNHQRYAEEVAMGLHDKKKKKAKAEEKKKSKITDNTAIQGEINFNL